MTYRAWVDKRLSKRELQCNHRSTLTVLTCRLASFMTTGLVVALPVGSLCGAPSYRSIAEFIPPLVVDPAGDDGIALIPECGKVRPDVTFEEEVFVTYNSYRRVYPLSPVYKRALSTVTRERTTQDSSR